MNSDMYQPVVEENEFGVFANFFIKYLNGSSSQNEAFQRASCTYRKLFKKIPYRNYKAFLSEFYESQHVK